MTLKRVIDADKICTNLLFLRKSASAFHRYRCQPGMSPVLPYPTPQLCQTSEGRLRGTRGWPIISEMAMNSAFCLIPGMEIPPARFLRSFLPAVYRVR